MVLRKPYALFIKLFKPIHLFSFALMCYLIYIESNVLKFFNEYLSSAKSVVGTSIKSNLISNSMYIIPIIIIIFSILIFTIMIRKKKPSFFYAVSIVCFFGIIIINVLTSNCLSQMENSIISIKNIKFIHDLILIAMALIEILMCIFLFRGIGINFKKFDFDSDIAKLDINESDKEEFEVDINFDINEKKTKLRSKIRNFKYIFLENKMIFILGFILVGVVIAVIIFILSFKKNNIGKEGNLYNIPGASVKVKESILLQEGYNGKKLTDNYLVILKFDLSSTHSIFLNDLNLKIGDNVFKPTTKYNEYLIDLGNSYDESNLPKALTEYLIVFEVPEKFINSDMLFKLTSKSSYKEIRVKPKTLKKETQKITFKINEEINFKNLLSGITFNISDYEIRDRFKIDYDFCIKVNDCIPSVEYLMPTLNQNYDKYILKINVKYSNESNVIASDFYQFFEKFGSIYYCLEENNCYIQKNGFEKIESKKLKDKNFVYIGINSEIMNANNISLVFNVRGIKYEYIIK